MKVSIILPVYNNQKSEIFTKCLDSLINQTYKNYELIIVDNNSTDNTLKIINDFKNKNTNKNINILTEKNMGRGAARRRGEINASGEIILMTDSDCIVPEDWIWSMIKPILENNFDAVQGFEINNNKNFWSEKIQQRLNCKYKNNKDIIGHIDTKNFAIKKIVLKQIGFSSNKYKSSNDTSLSIELDKIKAKIYFNKELIIRHENVDNIKAFFKKKLYRAYWLKIVSFDNKRYLYKNKFLKETNQTFISFFIFFPGLLITLIKNGYKDFYFNLIEGLAWRLGLILGIIYNYLNTFIKKL